MPLQSLAQLIAPQKYHCCSLLIVVGGGNVDAQRPLCFSLCFVVPPSLQTFSDELQPQGMTLPPTAGHPQSAPHKMSPQAGAAVVVVTYGAVVDVVGAGVVVDVGASVVEVVGASVVVLVGASVVEVVGGVVVVVVGASVVEVLFAGVVVDVGAAVVVVGVIMQNSHM